MLHLHRLSSVARSSYPPITMHSRLGMTGIDCTAYLVRGGGFQIRTGFPPQVLV